MAQPDFLHNPFEPTVFEPTVFEPTVFEPTVFEPTVFEPTVFEPTDRLLPEQVAAAIQVGAVLLDIRSQSARSRQGVLHGAFAVDQFLLSARTTPNGPESLSCAAEPEVWWILVSANGSSSANAVGRLRDTGLRRVTDVVGGFTALRVARRALAAASAQHVVRERATLAAHL